MDREQVRSARWIAYLTEEMGRRGYDQSKLARRLDTGPATVGGWVNKGSVPRGDTFPPLAEALKRPVLEVLNAAGVISDDDVARIAGAPLSARVLDLSQRIERLRDEDKAQVENLVAALEVVIAQSAPRGAAPGSDDWAGGLR